MYTWNKFNNELIYYTNERDATFCMTSTLTALNCTALVPLIVNMILAHNTVTSLLLPFIERRTGGHYTVHARVYRARHGKFVSLSV